MELREQDDTGWDELPGGLSFSDVGDEVDEGPRRRGVTTIAWLLVLGVLLGGGGAWGARWVGEADVRAVLASSTSTYAAVLERLRQASDAEALAAAAVGAPLAAERLEADLRGLSADGGSRRSAVAAQVAAEREVLVALGALGELDRAPLRVWGQAHGPLTEAAQAEESSRAALLLVDASAARRLPDTAAAVRRVASTVGEAVVGDVTRAAADLLTDLEAATGTPALRAAAERAEAQRAAVTGAAAGLGGGSDATVLAAFGDALLAVAELRALTPDATGVWPPARSRLEGSLQVVADADGSLAAGSVRGRLPLVLAAIDRLVTRAEQAQAEWRPVHDAAVAAQSADAAALRMHADRVRSATAGWPALRAAVGELARTSPPPPEQVDAAWVAADGVRLALTAAAPTAGVASAHAGLVAAVTAVEQPLRLARTGDAAAPSAAMGALAGFEPALASWEAALAAAAAEVAGRVPPPPPDV